MTGYFTSLIRQSGMLRGGGGAARAAAPQAFSGPEPLARERVIEALPPTAPGPVVPAPRAAPAPPAPPMADGSPAEGGRPPGPAGRAAPASDPGALPAGVARGPRRPAAPEDAHRVAVPAPAPRAAPTLAAVEVSSAGPGAQAPPAPAPSLPRMGSDHPIFPAAAPGREPGRVPRTTASGAAPADERTPSAPSRTVAEALGEVRRWVAAAPPPEEVARAPRAGLPGSGIEAREEVHLSIGTISVTIEDPAPARPPPAQPLPAPRSDASRSRLVRSYLRLD